MFIIIAFDRVLTRSFPVSWQDFFCSLPREQSRDVTPRLGVYSQVYFISSGRVDDLSFFEYLSPFCFLLIEFYCTFSISYKILPDSVYYCCI